MVYRAECRDCGMGAKVRYRRADAASAAEAHAADTGHTVVVVAVDGEESFTIGDRS